jgi:4-amino-4-deoxy-L-arabinose transferase-like glycosyltransferase
VSAATVAAWRRRRQADVSAAPEVADSDFAKAQLAGLAAVLSLAKAAAPPPASDTGPPPPTAPPGPYAPPASPTPPPVLVPAPARPASPVSPPGQAPTPARAAPGAAAPARLTDRPPAPVVTGHPAGPEAAANQRRRWGRVMGPALLRWPLLIAILAVQAALSLPLVWNNTAFLDEAIYLSAGHTEIEHWLHGTPAPAYATYFSGAPVIYPPIAAMADSIGGLAAARILSLIFMLGVTLLLWMTASKLFGKRGGACAAALFAVLGPTLRLGAFATFDAMALLLLAASVWCVVSSRDRDDSALQLLAGVVLLAAANITKYSTMIFDPSVIILAGLVVVGKRGVKPAISRSGYVAAGVIGVISVLLALGGPWYLAGALYTTISRAAGDSSAPLVLADAWKWSWPACAIAWAGVILCARRGCDRVQLMILVVFATSGTLAPLNQARIHTATSLSKHVDFGAWFAAAAAGYALAQLSQRVRWKSLRLTIAGLVLIVVALPAGIMGRTQALKIFHEWPNSAQMITTLRSLSRTHPGHYLAEDYDVPAYYLESTIPWQRWSGTWYFHYTPPGAARALTGLAAYRAAINHHYFSLIILDFQDTVLMDSEITTAMRRAGGYRVVAVIPSSVGQYTIWASGPVQMPGDGHDRR